MNPIKKTAFVILGMTSLSLGVIGIFLPVLPTTPFLLISAYSFGKSSKRLHHWLLTNKVFGSYISNYASGKGIILRHKLMILLLLWAVILTSALLFVSNILVKVILILIALAVSVHIVWIRTCREERVPNP
ncbi:MAG: YbaN family protein [Thermoplasmatota archaeon]